MRKNIPLYLGVQNVLVISDKTILIQLIKNPAGATETITAASRNTNINALIAINDNLADGRDISWLWDAEFEHLASVQGSFIVSGQRAEDMAVRLKYAGIPDSKIICIPSLEMALKEALHRLPKGGLLWVLPTYTCLLELKEIVKKFGVNCENLRVYWPNSFFYIIQFFKPSAKKLSW